MQFEKKVLLIDVDGTLYDKFRQDDNAIIADIFGNNILVEIVDKVLWEVNSFDLISNSMSLLNLRLFMYSVISLSSFSKNKILYKEAYEKSFFKYFKEKQSELRILAHKYKLIFVTNNKYTCYAFDDELNVHTYFYASNSKERKEKIKSLVKPDEVMYIIGNNYFDDVRIAKKMGIKSVYVGKSIIAKFFKADVYANSFSEVVNKIMRG